MTGGADHPGGEQALWAPPPDGAGRMDGDRSSRSTVSVAARSPRLDPALVRRDELFALLDEARRVTVVCAPAGAGKTSLIRAWSVEAELDQRIAWVSVARREHDPQAFWLAMTEALRAATSGHEFVVSLPSGLDSAATVDRLLEELSWLDEDVWLVLDDLHELESAEAIAGLERLLALAPRHLHWVLLTRRDLHLGLHLLRLDDELTEVRADDLRFSAEEARLLLEHAGVEISDHALVSLAENTEGWAAGLRLAALLLAKEDDPDAFAVTFSGRHRAIAEYLLAEVLDRQPAEVRRLLLRTSILERVCGSLADRLTGDTGSERLLLDLEDSGAFVVALDAERSWFRYHHLFGDLLALELRRTAPDELRGLQAAAAQWFAEHGLAIEAIGHAQAAEDWRLASELLADNWLSLELDGRRATIRRLLSGFPAGITSQQPELALVAAALERSSGSFQEAQKHLVEAARGAATVPDERQGRFQVALSFARLTLARTRNDLGVVAEEAGRLLARAEVTDGFGFVGDDLRAAALTELGIAEIWTGRSEQAELHLDRAIADARRIGKPRLELRAVAHRPLAGELRPSEMESLGNRAVELARKYGGEQDVATATAYLAIGAAALFRGQLRRAERWLEQSEELLEHESRPAPAVMLYLLRGTLELARNQLPDAMRYFAAVEPVEEWLVEPHMLTVISRWLRLRTWLRLGDPEPVRRALAVMDDSMRERHEMRLLLAELRLAEGDPEAAAEAIGPAIDPQTARQPMHEIQALILEAIARDELGDVGASSRALERALDLAEPEGLLLPFVLLPVPELLERHRRLRSTHVSLIAEIQDFLNSGTDPKGEGEVEQLAEPLSESELRVLRYLPTNLRGPEIAGELFVSLNTVRTHLRHIYAKLGVHDRTEAVARARALGLLAPGTGSRGAE